MWRVDPLPGLDASGAVAQGEGPKATRQSFRSLYRHDPGHYEQLSGYHYRNLKKFIQVGRRASPPDLPPFDDPGRMADWWKAHMTQRIPQRIYDWAAKAAASVEGDGAKGAETPSASTPTPSSAESSAAPVAPSPSSASSTYEAMLGRASEAELVAHARYIEALNATGDGFNESLIERRRDAWSQAAEQVRVLAKDKGKIVASDREWGKWSDFEEATQPKLAILNQSLRGIPVRIATLLGLSGDLFTSLVSTWNGELDSVFAHLADNDYTRARLEAPPREDLQLSAA